MKPSLSFLQDDLNITHVDDDRVKVTLVLPSEYLSQFIHLVDSLSGFVQALSRKSHHQKFTANPVSDFQIEQAEQNRSAARSGEISQRVVNCFT
jgi:translation elongation factor EF-4